MVNIDLRTTWSAECHATPTHKYCCCCYRDRHHQHQFNNERLRQLLSPHGVVMCFCESDPHEPWCREARQILGAECPT